MKVSARNMKGQSRQVHPIGEDTAYDNVMFTMDDLKPVNHIDKAPKRQLFAQDSVVDAGSIADKINLISSIQTAADTWRNFGNSKRIMKRKPGDLGIRGQEDSIRLLADMGIAELGSEDEDEPSEDLPTNLSGEKGKQVTDRLHNRALLQYVSKLARSRSENDIMDLYFLESMIDGGADISCRDRYGQTVLHEAARAWHVDVADFMIRKGAGVNVADKYGRTPLHVAAACNYPDMVKFLVDKGADIEARTGGIGEVKEEQTPCHYAAKNDATDALVTLYKLGCCLTVKDYKSRTPLHVAAELDRSESAALLLSYGADAGNQDTAGMTTITLMIQKMAHVAKEGLDQFHIKDRANRQQYYYLNRVEHKKPTTKEVKQITGSKSAIQAVVQIRSLDLIMHPVLEELIRVKWRLFGRKGMFLTILMDLLFAIIWSAILITYASSEVKFTIPLDIGRLILLFFGVIMMSIQIIKEIYELKSSKDQFERYVSWRREELQKDLSLVHPRWPEEKKYIAQEIDGLHSQQSSYLRDPWNVFDWVTYTLLIATIIGIVCEYILETKEAQHTTTSIMSISVIFVWVRLLKDFRAFRFIGPFIVIVGVIVIDVVKWCFLYLIFYIPYTCAFFALFGGKVEGYMTVNQVMFSMFRITLVDDYGYSGLYAHDPIMSDILCGTFLGLSAIISLNLFIALLSDTFQRVYDKSVANAAMQQATVIQALEEGLGRDKKNEVRLYIQKHCSPEVLYYDDDMLEEDDAGLKKITVEIKEQLDSLEDIISGGGAGSGSKDKHFDEIQEDLRDVRIQIRTMDNNFQSEMASLKEQHEEIKELLEKLTKGPGSGGMMMPGMFPSFYPPMFPGYPGQTAPPSGAPRYGDAAPPRRSPRYDSYTAEDFPAPGAALPVRARRRSKTKERRDRSAPTEDRVGSGAAGEDGRASGDGLVARMSEGSGTTDRNRGLRTITDVFPSDKQD